MISVGGISNWNTHTRLIIWLTLIYIIIIITKLYVIYTHPYKRFQSVIMYPTIQENQIYVQYVGPIRPEGLKPVNFSLFWSFIYSSIFTLQEDTSCSSILLAGCYNPSVISLPNGHILDKPEAWNIAVKMNNFRTRLVDHINEQKHHNFDEHQF